jgi:hypothetical protein
VTLLALTPALPLGKAGKFVAAAYLVFLTLIVIYVWIMARRLKRSERQLSELSRELHGRGGADELLERQDEDEGVGSLR